MQGRRSIAAPAAEQGTIAASAAEQGKTGMFNIRNFALIAVVVGALGATGCYADAYGPDVQEPVVAEGYTPQYYDGAVVYYDDYGRPFYYNGGVQVWVPPSSPYYGGYVNYYRSYGPAYRRWYAGYGYRYRTYNRGAYYGRGRGVYRGGYRGGSRGVYRGGARGAGRRR